MQRLPRPFFALTTKDLMSRDVTVIPKEMSLRGAARLLGLTHVTGAPVVDPEGRCVGVLSATDLARWVECGGAGCRRHAPATPPVCSDGQVLAIEALPADAVSCHMSTDLVTATPDAPIGAVARRMLE